MRVSANTAVLPAHIPLVCPERNTTSCAGSVCDRCTRNHRPGASGSALVARDTSRVHGFSNGSCLFFVGRKHHQYLQGYTYLSWAMYVTYWAAESDPIRLCRHARWNENASQRLVMLRA
jgi:hypothetical protein